MKLPFFLLLCMFLLPLSIHAMDSSSYRDLPYLSPLIPSIVEAPTWKLSYCPHETIWDKQGKMPSKDFLITRLNVACPSLVKNTNLIENISDKILTIDAVVIYIDDAIQDFLAHLRRQGNHDREIIIQHSQLDGRRGHILFSIFEKDPKVIAELKKTGYCKPTILKK